tara:strand:+ start:159 stop:614 length:456 start_codon:yes stop_codon:yes gene_type:complete
MRNDLPIDYKRVERAVAVGGLPGPIKRCVYFLIGAMSIVLGVIGIFIPLWPTTCFLLLAGWCFARSSLTAERWLHENQLFGHYLREYRERGIISSRVRYVSVATLWIFVSVSGFFLTSEVWAIALLLVVATAVTIHLYSLPTGRRSTTLDS